jgi:hypothetical protein
MTPKMYFNVCSADLQIEVHTRWHLPTCSLRRRKPRLQVGVVVCRDFQNIWNISRISGLDPNIQSFSVQRAALVQYFNINKFSVALGDDGLWRNQGADRLLYISLELTLRITVSCWKTLSLKD